MINPREANSTSQEPFPLCDVLWFDPLRLNHILQDYIIGSDTRTILSTAPGLMTMINIIENIHISSKVKVFNQVDIFPIRHSNLTQSRVIKWRLCSLSSPNTSRAGDSRVPCSLFNTWRGLNTCILLVTFSSAFFWVQLFESEISPYRKYKDYVYRKMLVQEYLKK